MNSPFSARSLEPTIIDRIKGLRAPGWSRTVYARRTLAALLVISALGVAVVDRSREPWPAVPVAAHDLLPGTVLERRDLTTVHAPPELTPGGVPDLTELVGSRVTAPVGAGEILTRGRILDSRLPARLTGDPGARLVAVHPADASSAAVLRTGDQVDVLTENGQVLARAAVVALTPGAASDRAGRASTPALLAMPEAAAHRVAAAALASPIAFVLH